MKKEQRPYRKEMFVCCNTKPDGSGCGAKGAEELRMKLKERVQALKDPSLKVTKSGCLGWCERGIVAVVYPEGKVFTEVTRADEEGLMGEMMNN